VEDRRYRQQGYKDDASQKQGKRDDLPRTVGMPGSRSISRCADCGTLLPVSTDPLGQCPNCRAELHACKQCAHFDPGHRFECRQPIPARVPDKRARNECAFFSLPVVVEAATVSGSVRPEDARRAFKNLFKKK
jgi:hypothetical protein